MSMFTAHFQGRGTMKKSGAGYQFTKCMEEINVTGWGIFSQTPLDMLHFFTKCLYCKV